VGMTDKNTEFLRKVLAPGVGEGSSIFHSK
jgi:hypothetical protein